MISSNSLLRGLDPVTVQAQKLNVSSALSDDAFVERDSILPDSLLIPTTEDVINVQASFISEPACTASTTKKIESSLPGGTILGVSTLSRKLSDAIRIFSTPSVHRGFLSLVNAGGAATTVVLAMSFTAVNTDFLFSHEKNPTTLAPSEV